ncbi:MAG: hypothetical protein Q7R42_05760 [Candidatus Planktophila sp.]|nr:hypothetical protein [Candidatus Planktophila sp.]
MTTTHLIEVDQRGRATLGKNKVTAGIYLLEIDDRGVISLHPAQVVKNAQERLDERPGLMQSIDTLSATKNLAPSKRGRPKRSIKS